MYRSILLVMLTLSITSTTLAAPHILVVLSNTSLIPGTLEKTGVWAEELVLPYELFKGAGFQVTLASPKGGEAVFDGRSLDPRVVANKEVRQAALRFRVRYAHLMRNTVHLAEIDGDRYDAIFVPGGHGVMFDVATDPVLAKLTVQFLRQGKLIGSVCHGPCFLAKARDKNGRFAARGYEVTGFSNEEEEGVKMVEKMPFSLEDELTKASGGRYAKGPQWLCHIVKSRNLITGQNPASSASVAKALIAMLVSPGKEVRLEEFVENTFQSTRRRPLSSLKTMKLPNGIAVDILRDGCTWDSGYVALLFGRRKPSCPKKRFLTELFRYTDMRFSAFGKGLKGYIVLATEDFEMAYLNWSSKKHFDRVTSSKKISALLDLPINHIELWKEARKYPTWLQR